MERIHEREEDDAYVSLYLTERPEEAFPRTQALLAHDLTMRLQTIADLPFHGYRTVHKVFAHALKEFDTMPILTLNHYMNRREALCRMMGLPFTTVAFTAVEQRGKSHE